MTTPEITPETPGQTLVAALSRQLLPGMEWDESEWATLDLIEVLVAGVQRLRQSVDAQLKAAHLAGQAGDLSRRGLRVATDRLAMLRKVCDKAISDVQKCFNHQPAELHR